MSENCVYSATASLHSLANHVFTIKHTTMGRYVHVKLTNFVKQSDKKQPSKST